MAAPRAHHTFPHTPYIHFPFSVLVYAQFHKNFQISSFCISPGHSSAAHTPGGGCWSVLAHDSHKKIYFPWRASWDNSPVFGQSLAALLGLRDGWAGEWESPVGSWCLHPCQQGISRLGLPWLSPLWCLPQALINHVWAACCQGLYCASSATFTGCATWANKKFVRE